MAELTLSIVSHGQGALARNLLSDIQALGIGANIVLTLNIPEDEKFLDTFRNLPIEVIRNTRCKGFGSNHNVALNRCTTPFFAVLNPDVRLEKDPFPEISTVSERFPNAAIFAPKVLDPTGAPEDSVRTNLSPWSLVRRRLFGDRRPILDSAISSKNGEFRWFAGMFLVLRAETMRALGGFDERFFMYCEDYDLCARAFLSGHQLAFVAGATVVHAAQRESHKSIVALARHIGSLLKVWTSSPVWRIAMGSLRRSV